MYPHFHSCMCMLLTLVFLTCFSHVNHLLSSVHDLEHVTVICVFIVSSPPPTFNYSDTVCYTAAQAHFPLCFICCRVSQRDKLYLGRRVGNIIQLEQNYCLSCCGALKHLSSLCYWFCRKNELFQHLKWKKKLYESKENFIWRPFFFFRSPAAFLTFKCRKAPC